MQKDWLQIIPFDTVKPNTRSDRYKYRLYRLGLRKDLPMYNVTQIIQRPLTIDQRRIWEVHLPETQINGEIIPDEVIDQFEKAFDACAFWRLEIRGSKNSPERLLWGRRVDGCYLLARWTTNQHPLLTFEAIAEQEMVRLAARMRLPFVSPAMIKCGMAVAVVLAIGLMLAYVVTDRDGYAIVAFLLLGVFAFLTVAHRDRADTWDLMWAIKVALPKHPIPYIDS